MVERLYDSINDFGITNNMNQSKQNGNWTILISAFVVMMVISIYQYSWFLFAYAINQDFGWKADAIGLVFTVFTYTATFVQPISGYITDRLGPRLVAVIASFLTSLGFILSSYARSPFILYFFYGAGGLGVGVLYGVSTASAIKWFPQKRGMATGIVVFGFGAGTALFNWIIQRVLETSGVSTAFLYVGIGMLVILVPLSIIYRYPSNSAKKKEHDVQTGTGKNITPFAMLATHQWYIIFFSFIATVSIVLIFGAQMKMLAEEFALPKSYLQVVLVLFPLGNGLSRVIAGSISDRIGRERTMVLFFSLLAVMIVTFIIFGRIPFFFVSIVFLAALLGGSPFALFPAVVGDYYGSRFSATNYGITYTAKAWAGLISGWLSAHMAEKLGSYQYLMAIIAICSLAAAVLCSPKILRSPKNKAIQL